MRQVFTLENYKNGRIDIEILMGKLKCGERNVYRILAKYKAGGTSALIHGLQGKPFNNKNQKWDWLEKYFKLKGFNKLGPTMMSEKIELKTGYHIPIETVRHKMIEYGYWLPSNHKKKVGHNMKERRIGYGILVQFDGSYHDWLGTGEIKCLLIAVDDATGEIIEAKFRQSERLEDITAFWESYFHQHGKPVRIILE